jgi:hypothetical protein
MFGIGDVFNAVTDIAESVTDVAGAAMDLVESAGDLAGEVAPFIAPFNPIAAAGLQAFSGATDLAEKFGLDQVMRDRSDDTWGKKDHNGEGKCGSSGGHGGGGCEGAGGAGEGGFFQQLAILLGGNMDKTAGDLLDKAKDLQKANDSEDKENFFTLSAEVQGLSQQMKVEGDTISNVLQSTGNASDALVRKG